MHATQPLAVTPRKQAQLLQQELGSGRCRAKRKAPSPPGPCKRFLPEQQQHGRVPRREAGSGGEGDGSHAAPCMCKRKQESGGGSPANLEKKRQRREAPGEQQVWMEKVWQKKQLQAALKEWRWPWRADVCCDRLSMMILVQNKFLSTCLGTY
ncbi:uncharacterized protein C9orf40 homolog isoform X2 [Microcaecilia unicolor]|uniref:Uncharacterized protein C9orf40 homolog isoform X2 n=1 Tax=Microcaecilia unicolor TaxID=1415580 RepID=A0A6P7WY92_9AMPH|nr:uncharacterized protein C9orf40 homolog isoform X2 [Microcaecilia unicolor]